MSTQGANAAAQAEIKARVQSWTKAAVAGDVDAIMSYYAPDIVSFDAIQQLQFKGADAYKKHWEMCIAMCPGPMVFETSELTVEAEDNVAFAHSLISCGGSDENGNVKSSWMRMTSCYRKIAGEWKTVHEHFSAPFDMQSGKALFGLEPDGSSKIQPIPQGMNAITPHLVCAGAADAIEFYKKAFNATEMVRLEGPEGKLMHGAVRIGDSVVMLMDEFQDWGALSPKTLKGTPVSVHLYVDDADAAMERAKAAGAKVVMPLDDTFWGDRYGVVEDPFGHKWSIATHIRDVSPQEIRDGAQKACA